MTTCAAATYKTFGGIGTASMSGIRPPNTAGPMARHRKPASVVESSGVLSCAARGAAVKTPSARRETERRMRMRRRVDVDGRVAGIKLLLDNYANTNSLQLVLGGNSPRY